jgi:hypothetical protein
LTEPGRFSYLENTIFETNNLKKKGHELLKVGGVALLFHQQLFSQDKGGDTKKVELRYQVSHAIPFPSY